MPEMASAATGKIPGIQIVVARDPKNILTSLMEAVKYNTPGQISHALYEVGGEYRRNM
ncbi:MAG: hypothetical protein WBR15_10100 [Gammaproteobacteria bacterium]